MESVFTIFDAIFAGVKGLIDAVVGGADGVFESIKNFSS